MALVIADRVKETSTSTGTGTINLAGAVSGFQTFVAGVGSTNVTYYTILDGNGTAWEIGYGTVTDASPDTLSRTVLKSSNSDNLLDLSAGTHTVFATYPASKSVHLDTGGALSHSVTNSDLSGSIDLTSKVTGTLPVANGGTGATSLDSLIQLNQLTDVKFSGTNFTHSILIGNNGAGVAPTTGTLSSSCQGNLGIGYDTLKSLSSGDYNVAIGYNAGNSITSGYGNILFGSMNVGQDIDTGFQNIAIGGSSMKDATSGRDNIAIGVSSLKGGGDTLTGDYNVALGTQALRDVTSGSKNVGIGYQAGQDITGTDSSLLFIANAKTASGGTLIKGDFSNKYVAVGKADVTFADAAFQIYPNGTNDVALYVKQIGSSSGDLILMENNTGTDQFVVSSSGAITTGSYTATAIDGAYIDIEGTEIKSTGVTGTDKYLRVDGDGTCSWQTVSTGSTLTQEEVEDYVSGLLTAGSNVSLTYNDSAGTLTIASTDTTYSVGDGGLTTNDFTNADHTKLDGIEASADVTDATNVAAAGALMDSEVTNLAQVKAFDSSDYATAAQGTKADSAQQPPSEGAFVDGDKTKLDGIAANANNYTLPSASLTAVGGVELATTVETTTGTDTTRAVTPAGVQAAIDDLIGGAPGALDTLNELAAAINDDASYASTITTALGLKAPIASPTFTGTVAIPNIADLESAVAANTAKVTNATHTGDVTGSTALTIAAGAVDIAMLSATGTASSSTFLRGDNTWVTPTDTNTTYTGGTNLTLDGTTFNVDDAFLINSGDDTTSGTITAQGFKNTGQNAVEVNPHGTSAGNTGEIRFLELAANGTQYVGFKAPDSIGSSDSQIYVLPASDGSNGQQLTTDGNGNLSWAAAGSGGGGEANEYSFKTISVSGQSDVVADTTTDTLTLVAGTNVTITTSAGDDEITITSTDTTYTKASFDVDHLFTLVGASADTDEHLGTFTGSTISDNQTIKAAIQALETAVETKGAGDITGVDLTAGVGISIDSETNTTSGDYSSTITCNLEGTELASTGETGTSKFLRVDGDGTCSWQVPPDTDTTYTKASFDLDHLFTLVGASADTDENLGTFTGSTISDSRTIKQALQDLETELETKTTNTGDITGVDLTAGVGISIDSETNTTSGDYSSTITCNLEGTELASTGETGTAKFLRVDGDGTCSWQVPPDTDTTYSKASFDLDHLFTLVGGSADTDENLGTFTGGTISDSRTIKQALQDLETELETKTTNTGDITGVDLTGGVGISIDSETNTGSGAYSSTITCNLEGTELASTGETGTAKFLRVDGDGTCSWQVPPDTDTTYNKASFDIDHLFTLVGASADTDENLGTFTGSTISDSRTIKQALQDLETELETKTTNTGDITGVDLTGGVGISIDSETNTGSGAYSSTITCNLEGTELASTGETGTSKFLRVDGDGTCSWQVPPDTDTTYTKASFDIDHLFTLVGASADTDEHLGTFTGSTIADNQTIKAAIQAVETAVETKGATAGSSSIVTVGALDAGSITSGFGNIDNGSSSIACGSLDVSDGNITNVGDIDCDSISIADAGTGLDIVFGGNTTLNKISLTDNLADALNINQGGTSYMKFVTTDNAESITTTKNIVQQPDMSNTALTGQSGSVVINANLGSYFTVATTGNITGLDIQNAVVGQKILIRFAWGGDHSIAFTDTVIWPGGTVPGTTASGVDVIGFICTTASSAFDGFIVGEDVKAA